ncbi:MarR family transcriptional regulator [Rhodococcus sp. D2-41]|uniref:MarR family transcriptional regulator n=1 Tax=Speluncibacter jeojiensis TaxID=2710754 RepID=A0A9X4RF96_9ACTN|nr:MarR family transcriptional regulator [Rhodococcus sp. D2-41]MDG3009586.1 MarR family transcriptional regulator [Rhodococcus sp. D2-41]MDG3016790.1 MarR family transcriptional regulator [Corynebacteriales bacterium D3-21]
MTPDPVAGLEAALMDIWRIGRVRLRERARELDPKLDPAGFPLLVLLTRQDAMPMSALVAELGIEKSTLTRQIDSAARLGLVERRTDPEDARARLVALTPDARRRLAAQRDVYVGRWREQLAQWDPDDVATLTGLLHRLCLTD